MPEHLALILATTGALLAGALAGYAHGWRRGFRTGWSGACDCMATIQRVQGGEPARFRDSLRTPRPTPGGSLDTTA